jgi:hypothetical protein
VIGLDASGKITFVEFAESENSKAMFYGMSFSSVRLRWVRFVR